MAVGSTAKLGHSRSGRSKRPRCLLAHTGWSPKVQRAASAMRQVSGYSTNGERWLSLDDAPELVDPIMHGNARRVFRLAEKENALRRAS